MRQKWLQKPPLGTPINWSHPSAKGRVGDWIFNEGGGDLVNDLSGNANHGTLKNMAFPPTTASGWNPGRAGVGLKFDGANDYVDCGSSIMNFSADNSNFSVLAWIKTSYDAEDNYILGTDLNTGFYFKIVHTTGPLVIKIDDGVNDESGGGTTTINDGNWHFIALTLDSVANTFLGYIDGNEEITLTTGSVGDLADTFKIGNISDWGYFNGQIDQVRIYNRALSAEEVLDSYVNPFGRFERTKWGLLVPTAPPSGLSIPIAMHNYRRLRA